MTQKIVLIESDAALAADLRAGLEAAGYVVSEIHDASQAIDFLKADPPDLIYLSVETSSGPRDGYAICGRIKRIGTLKDIPLVLGAADSSGFAQHMTLKSHASVYLQKPFDSSKLVEALSPFMPISALSDPPARADDLLQSENAMDNVFDSAFGVGAPASDIPENAVLPETSAPYTSPYSQADYTENYGSYAPDSTAYAASAGEASYAAPENYSAPPSYDAGTPETDGTAASDAAAPEIEAIDIDIQSPLPSQETAAADAAISAADDTAFLAAASAESDVIDEADSPDADAALELPPPIPVFSGTESPDTASASQNCPALDSLPNSGDLPLHQSSEAQNSSSEIQDKAAAAPVESESMAAVENSDGNAAEPSVSNEDSAPETASNQSDGTAGEETGRINPDEAAEAAVPTEAAAIPEAIPAAEELSADIALSPEESIPEAEIISESDVSDAASEAIPEAAEASQEISEDEEEISEVSEDQLQTYSPAEIIDFPEDEDGSTIMPSADSEDGSDEEDSGSDLIEGGDELEEKAADIPADAETEAPQKEGSAEISTEDASGITGAGDDLAASAGGQSDFKSDNSEQPHESTADEVQTAEEGAGVLSAQVRALRSELETLRADLNARDSELSAAKVEACSAITAKEMIEADLKEAQKALAACRAEVEALTAAAAVSVPADLAASDSGAADTCPQQAESAPNEVNSLSEEEIQALRAENASLKSELDSLKSSLETARAECNAAQEKCTELEDKNTALEAEKNDLEQQFSISEERAGNSFQRVLRDERLRAKAQKALDIAMGLLTKMAMEDDDTSSEKSQIPEKEDSCDE